MPTTSLTSSLFIFGGSTLSFHLAAAALTDKISYWDNRRIRMCYRRTCMHTFCHVCNNDQIAIIAGYVVSMIIIYAQWQRIHLSLIIKKIYCPKTYAWLWDFIVKVYNRNPCIHLNLKTNHSQFQLTVNWSMNVIIAWACSAYWSVTLKFVPSVGKMWQRDQLHDSMWCYMHALS